MSKRKPAPTPRRPGRKAALHEVFTYRTSDGYYGLFQVIATDREKETLEVVALDYEAKTPPTLEDAAKSRPYVRKWGNHEEEPARCIVQARPPYWAESLGVLASAPHFETPCNSYGGWPIMLAGFYRRQWERGEQTGWKSDPTEIPINLGGGPVRIRRDSSRIAIGKNAMLKPASDTLTRWSALDALPYLSEITYHGSDPGFLHYVKERKLRRMAWHEHRQRSIDLRSTAVNHLILQTIDEDLTLYLGDVVSDILVFGPVDRVRLEDANLGFPFDVRIAHSSITALPKGSESLESLVWSGIVEGDTRHLLSLPHLRELTLCGAPGKLVHADALGRMPTLKELTLMGLYDLDVAHWGEQIEALDFVEIRGLRKADADALKAHLATVPVLNIKSARTDEWIRDNLENPFRDWEEDNPAFGRAACAAWKKARTKATKLGKTANEAEALAVLKELVLALNKLDEKYSIDTIRREEAGDAFMELANDMGISEAVAAEQFDAHRDF